MQISRQTISATDERPAVGSKHCLSEWPAAQGTPSLAWASRCQAVTADSGAALHRDRFHLVRKFLPLGQHAHGAGQLACSKAVVGFGLSLCDVHPRTSLHDPTQIKTMASSPGATVRTSASIAGRAVLAPHTLRASGTTRRGRGRRSGEVETQAVVITTSQLGRMRSLASKPTAAMHQSGRVLGGHSTKFESNGAFA